MVRNTVVFGVLGLGESVLMDGARHRPAPHQGGLLMSIRAGSLAPPRRRRSAAVAAVGALLAPAALIVGAATIAPAAHAATTATAATPASVTFTYPTTGSFTAPGTGTLTIAATGGSGGNGGPASAGGAGGFGGVASVVTETLQVTPSEQFDAYPGGAAPGPHDRIGPGGATFPNLGGGNPGVSPAGAGGCCAGGGGGASAVVDHASGTFEVVAAGGGGGGAGGVFVGYTGGAGANGDQPGAAGAGLGAGVGGSGYVTGSGENGVGTDTNWGYGGPPGGGGGGVLGGRAGNPGLDGGGGGGGAAGGQSFVPSSATLATAAAPGIGSITFTFTPVPTAVATHALSFSADPTVAGSAVTLTDTLSPPGSGWAAPTGFVTFSRYDPRTGTSTTLGATGLTNSVATWSTSTLAVGTDDIYASYTGDDTYLPDNSPILAETVTAPPETVSPGLVDFGTQTVGAFTSVAITVTDTGTRGWAPSGVTSSSPDIGVAPSSSCLAGMGLGFNCQLVVTYRPSALGTLNATLTVSGNFPAFTIPVTGTAMAAPQPVGGGGHW